MNKVHLNKTEVIKSLAGHMASLGWRGVGENEYVRKSASPKAVAVHMLYLAVTDLGGSVKVALGVNLRISPVEEVFHKISKVPPEFHGQTYTIGKTLFPKRRFLREESLEVEGKEGIEAALPFIEKATQDSFFSEYATLDMVGTALNASPKAACPVQPNEWHRSARGVIIAAMLGDAGYDQLCQTYLNKMKSLDRGFYVPFLSALIEYTKANVVGRTDWQRDLTQE